MRPRTRNEIEAAFDAVAGLRRCIYDYFEVGQRLDPEWDDVSRHHRPGWREHRIEFDDDSVTITWRRLRQYDDDFHDLTLTAEDLADPEASVRARIAAQEDARREAAADAERKRAALDDEKRAREIAEMHRLIALYGGQE